MTSKLVRRKELKKFIVDFVIGEDYDKRFIANLKRFIAREYSDEPEAGLCEYLGLGRWFDSEMVEVGLTANSIITELKNRIK